MIMVKVSNKYCNTFSQDFYDKLIDSINFASLTCSCDHSGCLVKHGYYSRSIRYKYNKYTLTVLRVKCRQCGKTHAILLSSIVPYSQIVLEDQIKIITDYESGSDFMSILNSNDLIDPREVYYIISKYKKIWKNKLLSEFLKITETITEDCYKFFKCQFMQIRCGPYYFFSDLHITFRYNIHSLT